MKVVAARVEDPVFERVRVAGVDGLAHDLAAVHGDAGLANGGGIRASRRVSERPVRFARIYARIFMRIAQLCVYRPPRAGPKLCAYRRGRPVMRIPPPGRYGSQPLIHALSSHQASHASSRLHTRRRSSGTARHARGDGGSASARRAPKRLRCR